MTELLSGKPVLLLFVVLAVGPAFGMIRIKRVSIGAAAGPLLVGLVLGRLGRTGPVVWSLPHQSSEAMSHLGLLIFLAYAGGRAGSAFVDTIRSPLGIKVFLVGAAITAVHAAGLLLVARWLDGMSGPRLAGMIAGSQTQPAVLAYANHRTTYDQRVALGYPLV
ncbi:MAG TPA: hypothetical protein VES01_01160 [Dermatophilaceae bacterium]|nr:hypothetical protein [Dermatophilaceae bacterium]